VLLSIAAGAFSFYLFQKLEDNKADLNGLKLEIGGQLTGKLDGVSGKFNNVSDRFNNVSDRISRFNDELSKINSNIKQNDSFAKQELTQQNNTIKQQNNLIANLNVKLQESERAQEISNQQIIRSLDMGDPGIISIRKAIAEELIQLKAVPVVDVPGMQVILSSMIKHSRTLSVLDSEIPGVEDLLGSSIEKPQQAEKKSDQEQSKLEQFQTSLITATDKFLQELKNLVVYRNTKVAATALIAPEQKFFLQQHVTLKMETARKALLDGRNELFHSLLGETEEMLQLQLITTQQ